MNESEQIRETIVSLREKANMSQADVADRVKFTSSRLSRLESGDTELSVEDAELIANGIGTEEAKAFAKYLKTEWKLIERPAFNHVSREILWQADQALQRVAELEADPNVKNAFLQQIRSCRQALEDAAKSLLSTEHSAALIGPPGVGKTTIICTLAKLRKLEHEINLDKQMALQTGGGRQTLCEVHVRNGGEFNISVEPCNAQEIQQYVVEFCGDLVDELNPDRTVSREGPGLSAEADRAIRNMTGLSKSFKRGKDGKSTKEDQALDLAKKFPNKDDLIVQVLTKMDLPRRNRTSISFPRDSAQNGLDWLSKTFAEVNYGRHAEFSLPKRIEITVPIRLLGAEDLDMRMIDTRGVDEPTAPRPDLQAYLDDERAVIVLCSGFTDAPEGAIQTVIQKAVQSGLKEQLLARGVLLVLPGGSEECSLRDPATGEQVANAQEGREIRRDQVAQTLHAFGFRDLPVVFADVRVEDDCEKLQLVVLEIVTAIRRRKEEEIVFLTGTIDRLINNRQAEETRAVFNEATKLLRNWLATNMTLAPADIEVQEELIGDMDRVRFASSLRASVNRYGNWDNFHYWHGLGMGTRNEAVVRATKQLGELKVLVEAVLRDEQLAPAHDLIKHFANEMSKMATTYEKWAQALGEGAFKSQLGEDIEYWRRCQGRWGGGPGYKSEISRWTSSWFDTETGQRRTEFIESELQRQWAELVGKLKALLASADTQSNGGAEAVG